jgi:hypothetical protein
MAKFYGAVGFSIPEEIRPGVYNGDTSERMYKGDVLNTNFKWQESSKVNDDLNITNRISILADSFIWQNFGAIVYVTFMNAKWKVTNVESQYPRLVLSVGGLYT